MPTSIFMPEVQAAFDEATSTKTKAVRIGTRSVDIPIPFPSPEDWHDQWIYFLMVDRFNNPAGPPNSIAQGIAFDQPFGEFQGGTFDGIRTRLDYIQQLGRGGHLAHTGAEELPVRARDVSRLWHPGFPQGRAPVLLRPRHRPGESPSGRGRAAPPG